jgi:hypothetical protein
VPSVNSMTTSQSSLGSTKTLRLLTFQQSRYIPGQDTLQISASSLPLIRGVLKCSRHLIGEKASQKRNAKVAQGANDSSPSPLGRFSALGGHFESGHLSRSKEDSFDQPPSFPATSVASGRFRIFALNPTVRLGGDRPLDHESQRRPASFARRLGFCHKRPVFRGPHWNMIRCQEFIFSAGRRRCCTSGSVQSVWVYKTLNSQRVLS